MKPSEVAAFANSLADGSEEVQHSIWAYYEHQNRPIPETLFGAGWFHGFKNRNKDTLSSSQGTQMHLTCQDWTTYTNIKTMYELVYEQMAEAGIARHLPEEEQYWVDTASAIVDSEEKAAGLKCTIKLEHPQWLLFGDEVGTNTAQDGDGHIGGQTYITFRGQHVKLNSSKSTGRFTVMGLTAATGEPDMCVVIMAAQEVGIAEALGFDHLADSPYNSTKTLEENRGKGKALPGLPTCLF